MGFNAKRIAKIWDPMQDAGPRVTVAREGTSVEIAETRGRLRRGALAG